MKTTYNPLLRATRLALTELTTPEAQRWYWQQIWTSAVLAQKITLQGVTVARHWVSAIHGQAAVVEPVQTDAPTQSTTPGQTDGVVEPQDNAPASRLTEAQASTLNELQEHEAIESVAEAANLEPQIGYTAWSATEEVGGDADDYEPLEVRDATSFDDSLECGPPFLNEEDIISLDEDSWLDEETESDSSDLTSDQWGDLASVIQEFKQQQVIPSESIVKHESVQAVHVFNGTAGATAFSWEDTSAEGNNEVDE